jgi:hypothetical protein
MNILATTGLVTSVMCVSAVWGYAASWVNQVVKQNGFPTWMNALIADGVVVISAAFALMQANAAFTWATFGSALFAAFSAALINHQFILSPTGIGEKIKTATSFVK